MASEEAVVRSSGLDWVRDAVFYQVFCDRFRNGDPTNDPSGTVSWDEKPTRENFFGGDMAGIREQLPYLQQLGITALYLTPVFRAGTNHRYDTHDYFEVDPALGDAEALRSLVDAAHAAGIRVVLDGVFNHVGDGFWAFQDLVAHGPDSAYRDWFFLHRPDFDPEHPGYQTCGGAPYLPKLNTGHRDVRDHLLRAGVHWIEQAGIDGWRLDVPWKVPTEFWRSFRARVKQAKPDAYLVGEAWWTWGQLPQVFDGLMNYRLRLRLLDFCLFDAADAEDLAIDTATLLEESGGGQLMLNLLGSHDTPRLLTLAGDDEERAVLALAALFTFPGTPMLYYGDEVGLEGGDDPDCRRTFPWDESRWNTRIADAVRTFIALRREHAALRRGAWEPILTFNRLLIFRRLYDGEEALIVLNAGAAQSDLTVELPLDASHSFEDAITGAHFPSEAARLHFDEIPARSALILIGEGAASD